MELQILDLLVSHGGTMQYVDVIKSFPSGVETNGFLQLLRRDDYIQCSFQPHSHVSITPPGRAYRSKLRNMKDECDRQKNDSKRIEDTGNRQAKYGLVSAVFSVVAAVLTFLSLTFMVLQHFHVF